MDRFKSRRCVGQRHRDGGSFSELALDVQRAVMEVDQRLGDRQAQAPAQLGLIGVGIDPGKRIGQFRQLLGLLCRAVQPVIDGLKADRGQVFIAGLKPAGNLPPYFQ